MVPLLTLAQAMSSHQSKHIPEQSISRQMTSCRNDLFTKDLPVDVELSCL
jgi:hypothetical protein